MSFRTRRAVSRPRGDVSRPQSPRHQHPIVEVEDDGGIVGLAILQWEIRTRTILGRDRAQAQRAHSVRPGSSPLPSTCDHANTVSPANSGGTCAAAVDGRDLEGVGEAVEREGARQRDRVAAVDQPAAEAALASTSGRSGCGRCSGRAASRAGARPPRPSRRPCGRSARRPHSPRTDAGRRRARCHRPWHRSADRRRRARSACTAVGSSGTCSGGAGAARRACAPSPSACSRAPRCRPA